MPVDEDVKMERGRGWRKSSGTWIDDTDDTDDG
jgi:hypothetical protein